jgi:hypothetical protein
MSQMNECAAEALSPEQATAVVHLLDLQARWENHREDPSKSAGSTSDLQARQKAFDVFRSGLRDYAAKYRGAVFPEPTQNVPERLAVWCRTLRAVFRRAEGGNPIQVMTKVYRLADRIAARVGKEVVGRAPVGDLATSARELDVVIAWCEGLAALGPLGDSLRARQGDAA